MEPNVSKPVITRRIPQDSQSVIELHQTLGQKNVGVAYWLYLMSPLGHPYFAGFGLGRVSCETDYIEMDVTGVPVGTYQMRVFQIRPGDMMPTAKAETLGTRLEIHELMIIPAGGDA